jgi:hypothetical protein
MSDNSESPLDTRHIPGQFDKTACPQKLISSRITEAVTDETRLPSSRRVDHRGSLHLGGHPKPAIDGHLKTGHHST